LDLRGHGKSGRIAGHYRPEHYVTDIVAFLNSQFTEGVILFGHSLGGWIVLMVEAECTEKVRGLILGDPPLCLERFLSIEGSDERVSMWRTLRGLAGSGMSVPELASNLANMQVSLAGQDATMRYGDLPGVDDAHLLEWAETLIQVDPDVVKYHAEGRLDAYVEQVNFDTLLRHISCPVLLLQADPSCGGVISDDDVKDVISLLSEGSHVKLFGAGHNLGLGDGNVDLLQKAVAEFLESLY
jgi:pimeloyl-ACP methyl ester carboxylesterase